MVGRDRINKLKNKEIQINVKSAGTVLPVTRMRQRVFASARLTGASVAGASPAWERVNHPPSHEPCVVRREA